MQTEMDTNEIMLNLSERFVIFLCPCNNKTTINVESHVRIRLHFFSVFLRKSTHTNCKVPRNSNIFLNN